MTVRRSVLAAFAGVSAALVMEAHGQPETVTTSPTALLPTTVPTTASLSYTNPFSVPLADPYVLKEGDTYYLYGTSTVRTGFEVYTSRDLLDWKREGLCYQKSDEAWGKTDFWAPEVVKKDGKFFMFFTARNPEAKIRNICVATADSPRGPFTEVKAPLLPGMSVIDPHAYLDPASGDWYLYATREPENPNVILGAKLKDSLLELETSLTRVLAPDQEWERGWTEAPFVVKHKDWYYMTYSGCAFWDPRYAIGYAVAKHPLGPWKKSEANPVLRMTDTVHAPGHNSIIVAPDGKTQYIVYHRHKAPGEKKRFTAMDVIRFEPDPAGPDRMVCPDGPSCTVREMGMPAAE